MKSENGGFKAQDHDYNISANWLLRARAFFQELIFSNVVRLHSTAQDWQFDKSKFAFIPAHEETHMCTQKYTVCTL